MDGLIALSLAKNYIDSVGDEIKSSKKLIIPDGTTVVTAAMVPDRDIEYVELPGSVARIDDEAFMNCKYLKSVHIHKTIDDLGYIEIGSRAFLGCSGLETFEGHDLSIMEIALKNVSESAFEDCINLNVFFKLSGDIGMRAFYRCLKLTCCIIANIDLIGSEAFSYCCNLNYVNFYNSFSIEVGSYAFCNCVNLKNFSFDSSAFDSIGQSAFEGCLSLEQIGLEVVKSISYHAFDSSGIKYLIIDNLTTTIASNNFINNCYQLTDIIIFGTPDIINLDSYAITSHCLRIFVREDNLSFFQNHQLWSVIYNMGIIVKIEDNLDYLRYTKGINIRG